MSIRKQTVRPSSWLQLARQAAGLTQEELAERAGISKVALGRIENDLREPREATKRCLAVALDLPAYKLFPEGGPTVSDVLDAYLSNRLTIEPPRKKKRT